MRHQNVVVLWHYLIIVVAPELKTNSSNIKTSNIDYFLIALNVLDSSDIILSGK